MKRTMIVMFALAMLLAWSGSAMATTLQNYKIANVAHQNCGPATDRWFGNAEAAAGNFVHLFNYFPGTDGWWNGFAVINTDGAYTIPADNLCIVGVNTDGTGVATVYGNPIYPQNMAVALVDALGEDAKWENEMYLGVFAKNAAAVRTALGDELTRIQGFGMMGDGAQGQGYFGFYPPTDQAAAPDAAAVGNPAYIGNVLAFNYLPEAPWWKGVAIVNTHNSTPIWLTIVVQQENGSSFVTSKTNRIQVNGGAIKTFTGEQLKEITGLTDMNLNQRARIMFYSYNDMNTANTANANGQHMFGFAMFGDGQQGQGYLPLAGTNLPAQ